MDAHLLHRPRQAAGLFGAAARTGTDLLLIGIGFWLAYIMRYQAGLGGSVDQEDFRHFRDFLPVALLLSALAIGLFAVRGGYRLTGWSRPRDEVRLIASSLLSAFALLIVFVYYSQEFSFSRLIFVYAFVLDLVLLTARPLARIWLGPWMQAPRYQVDRVIDVVLAVLILVLGIVPMLLIALEHHLAGATRLGQRRKKRAGHTKSPSHRAP
ncbi:MAG: hypothetical protein ACTHMJ_20840 [Thermomicrobiales bacterium]|jgi:hypothetical protein